jgi:hypothetical protein
MMKQRGMKMTSLYIFYNGLTHLKEGKDEVEGQEDDHPVYIQQWTHPPEGREG